MKKVFISIVNYNGKASTKKCLQELEKLEEGSFKLCVVVVDNNSTENFDLKEEDFKNLNLKIIRLQENLGFSGGHNKGISYAIINGADYVLILNNDVLLDKNLIKELLEPLERDKSIGITVPKIYFAKGFEFHKDRYSSSELGKVIWYAGGEMDWRNLIGFHRGVDEVDGGQYDESSETNFATGCCMMVKKEVFEKVGLFNEKYFLYYEDSDLSIRVRKAGFKIIFIPTAVIWHENAGSTGGSGSKLQDYYISRNRLLFGTSYAPFRTKISLVKESLLVLLNGREQQKKGTRDFYLRKFGRGSYR